MRNIKGGSKTRKHSRSVSLAAGVYCSTQRSRARTQYTQTCSSRVLRIRAARSWVKLLACTASIRSLRGLRPPSNRKGPGPHRCWWISFPDIFGAPGRGRRDCVNPIRRARELNLHRLHRHATEEEGFGGSCSVCVAFTTSGANGWWSGRRRKNGRRRGSPQCGQVQGQGGTDLGVHACTAPVSGSAGPAASWRSERHTSTGPRSSWWFSWRSRPTCTSTCWLERSTVAWTGHCSF